MERGESGFRVDTFSSSWGFFTPERDERLSAKHSIQFGTLPSPLTMEMETELKKFFWGSGGWNK
jgi:hypothetical protein